MNKISATLWVVLFMLPICAHSAQVKSFTAKEFTLEYPEGWEDHADLFGLPYVFLGPQISFKRPSVAVVPSGNEKIKISESADEKTIQVFNENKKSWVAQHDGEIIEFLPYQRIQTKKLKGIHKFSVRYKLGKESFQEVSYYFHCGTELFHVKSLSADKDVEGNKAATSLVESIGCKL